MSGQIFEVQMSGIRIHCHMAIYIILSMSQSWQTNVRPQAAKALAWHRQELSLTTYVFKITVSRSFV